MSNTGVTPASFRGAFPAFKDIECYPDTEVNWWIHLADKLHSTDRWGDLLEFGASLWVAHNLAIENNAKTSAASGNNPGDVVGPVVSGSVDKVSYGRSLEGVMDPSAGHWNLTSYGLRYIRLARLMGAGPIYVGGPSSSDNQSMLTAWSGPYSVPNPS